MSHVTRMAAVLLSIVLLASLTSASADDAGDEQQAMARFLNASRAEHDARVAWTEQLAFDFESPDSIAGFKVIDGKWEIRAGQLVAIEGQPQRNRTLLLTPCAWKMLRVEFDAVVTPATPGRVGDICVRFGDPQTGSFAKHYALITGQYYNQATVCYRRNIPIARTEWSPLVAGKKHHVVLEFTANHLRYWVDGKVVLDAWDREQPLDVSPTWLGLSTYDSTLAVDNLKIASGEWIAKRK